MLYLAFALAAPPSDLAQTALQRTGPHTAHYVKESTDKPVLDVTYNGPREATITAFSPDGTFSVSVDATHMRLRVDATTCTSIDAGSIFEAANQAGGPQYTPPGPPASGLVYRVKPDGSIDLSAIFHRATAPPLFSWHIDLDDAATKLTSTDGTWNATLPTHSWSVRESSGKLTRMSVGDDALVLSKTTLGPESTGASVMKAKPTLPRAKEVCDGGNDPELERAFTGQMRLYAYVSPFTAVAEAWPTLDGEARAAAQARQQAWWRSYFAADMPTWAESMKGGPWQASVKEQMSDVAAFRAFEAGLPTEAKAQALEHWKRAWYGQVGQDMVGAHIMNTQKVFRQPLEAEGIEIDVKVLDAVLVQPMTEAALAEAELVLANVLVPVIEAGAMAIAMSKE